jgi:hypothetical protein
MQALQQTRRQHGKGVIFTHEAHELGRKGLKKIVEKRIELSGRKRNRRYKHATLFALCDA